MNLSEYINQSKKIIPTNFMKTCKIAILSNFTITGLGETIRVLCSKQNIYAELYTSEYNQYAQEILNKDSNLYKFKPDIIFLLITPEYFLGEMYDFPYRLSGEERKKIISQKFKELENILTFLKENVSSKIILNNFLVPIYSSRGILENKQSYGLMESIKDFNKMLENLTKEDFQIFIFDINIFVMKEGYNSVLSKMNYLADMKLSPSSIVSLANEYLAYIFPLMSLTKKCIVLDLDNTLWGGIIGEDGIANIKLGPEKEGKPFYDFQKKLLELSERGIILTINSKNNPKDALDVIQNHPYMLLREDKFASIRINWNDKVRNLNEISNELNIGKDSLVFIDDDKTNRELVRELLPEIFVVDLPEDPCSYVTCLENLKIFNSFSITREDLEKQEMYLSQRKREEFKSQVTDLESFLKGLNLEIVLEGINSFNLPRASQLSQKTNQFNLTTKRYTEENLDNLLKNKDNVLKLIHVKDRFGDYGITGLAVLRKIDQQTFELENFLLSCRILGKNIEFVFLQELIYELKDKGVQKIIANFIPTEKNAPSANFLNEAGFVLIEECVDKKHYFLNIGDEIKKQSYAEIKHVNT